VVTEKEWIVLKERLEAAERRTQEAEARIQELEAILPGLVRELLDDLQKRVSSHCNCPVCKASKDLLNRADAFLATFSANAETPPAGESREPQNYSAAQITADELLRWMKNRPGVSWIATIKDVEEAVEALRLYPDPEPPKEDGRC
jgi:hypothetical protein